MAGSTFECRRGKGALASAMGIGGGGPATIRSHAGGSEEGEARVQVFLAEAAGKRSSRPKGGTIGGSSREGVTARSARGGGSDFPPRGRSPRASRGALRGEP